MSTPTAVPGPGFTVTAALVNDKDPRVRASQAQNLAKWLRWANEQLNNYIAASTAGAFGTSNRVPQPVAANSAPGSGTQASRDDHIHEGAHSVGGLRGDVAIGAALSAGGGVLNAIDATGSVNGVVRLAGQLGGSAAAPDVRGIRETGGPTLLTIGAIADGAFVKRSGGTAIGGNPPLVDVVWQLPTLTALTLTGPLTNSLAGEFLFGGSSIYPSSLTDIFAVTAASTGAGIVAPTLKLYDFTNSLDLATVSVTGAVNIYSTTTFTNIPSSRARIQLQSNVAAGEVCVLTMASWTRYR